MNFRLIVFWLVTISLVSGAEPEAVLAKLRATVDTELPRSCSPERYAILSELQADEIVAILDKLGPEFGDSSEADDLVLEHLLGRLVGIDDDATLKWMSGYPKIRNVYSYIFRRAVAGVRRNDPEVILKLGEVPEDIQTSIWIAMVAEDIDSALAFLALPADGNYTAQQWAWFRHAVKPASQTKPLTFANWMAAQEKPDFLLYKYSYFLVSEWAKAKPVEALDWILANPKPNGFNRRKWLERWIDSLPRDNPTLLRETIRQMPRGSLRRKAIEENMPFKNKQEWIESLPEKADRRAARLAAHQSYNAVRPVDPRLISYVEERAAVFGYTRTLKWAVDTSFVTNRHNRVRALFHVWSKVDPKAAATAIESISDEATRKAARL